MHISNDAIGLQGITETSTTKNHPYGMTVRVQDSGKLASNVAMAAYSTCTITGTAPAMGLTDTAAAFTQEYVGSYIVFGGTHTTAANSCVAIVTGVVDATHLLFDNINGVAEAFGSSGTYTVLANLGPGEAVYAKGVASTVRGDLCVIYGDGTTARAVSNGAKLGRAGIALSANVANQYGWYLVYGVAPITQTYSTIGTSNGPLYVFSTAGQMDDVAVGSAAGLQVVGANSVGTNRQLALLSYPTVGTTDATS